MNGNFHSIFKGDIMDYKDCQYRYINDEEELCCKNKQDESDNGCDNCKENIHLNCDNYNAKRDMCLKFFRDGISELKECQEKTVFSDSDLQKKWSN